MRRFAFSVFIERRPQEVFDFAANPDNDHLWQENLISSEWITPEPAGVGSVKRVVSRLLGRKVGTDVAYTEWQRPHGYGIEGGSGPFSFSAVAKLEAQDEGTLIDFAGQVWASGVMKLVEGWLGRRAEKQDRANYERLKRVMEGG